MNLWEIDRLVAEKVMGYSRITPNGNVSKVGYYEFRDGRYKYVRRINSFQPTWHMEDAWLVVEKLRETSIFSLHDAWDEDDNKIFCVNFQYNDTYHVVNYEEYAETASLAICLAALKAVGVDVE